MWWGLYDVKNIKIATHMAIARQRLCKHARNTHAANNTGVLSMWSASRLFARQLSGNTPLQL
jgi:hypothetical protein